MRKIMMRFLAGIVAVLTVFGLVACSGGGTVSSSSDGGSSEEAALQRYFAPVVKVSKTGLATWTDLEGAEKFAYSINGGAETETTEKSVQLDLNDKIVVKCVGNGTTRRTSRWSEPVQYVPAHSYVIEQSGARGSTFNVYKTDGTVVLDTINHTKNNGDVMTAGEEYIFEFDITSGPYHNALLIAGVEDAVISDLTWTNRMYTERDGEKADTSDKFYEVLYNTSYRLYPDYATIHRSDWSYAGTYFPDENGVGMSTYGWNLKSTPAMNENGVYDTSKDGFWTVDPNWCSTIYGGHFLSTKKQTKERMDSGYKYVRFKIKYNSVRCYGAPCVDGVEEYGNTTLGKEEFNFYALVHQAEKYLFFNSDDVTERESRSDSYATDDNGKSASDVTLYDASTGEKIFANGSHGNVLAANKKYILEIDAEGTLNGSVALTGIENALLSNVTWSDKTYDERNGENAVSDTLRVLEMDTASHHLEAEHPLFHRLWKTSDGYTGNYTRNCRVNENGEIDTSDVSNRSTENNRCMEFARKIWLASAKTSKEAGRKYFRITVEWKSFDTILVGHVVEDKNDPNYGRLAGYGFNAFIYSPAGGRYLYLTAFSPA